LLMMLVLLYFPDCAINLALSFLAVLHCKQ
jgi:hypothetical protein